MWISVFLKALQCLITLEKNHYFVLKPNIEAKKSESVLLLEYVNATFVILFMSQFNTHIYAACITNASNFLQLQNKWNTFVKYSTQVSLFVYNLHLQSVTCFKMFLSLME